MTPTKRCKADTETYDHDACQESTTVVTVDPLESVIHQVAEVPANPIQSIINQTAVKLYTEKQFQKANPPAPQDDRSIPRSGGF
jgi:hypothetical protein